MTLTDRLAALEQPCRIRWMNDRGEPTPDNNPSIGRVKHKSHRVANAVGGVAVDESPWYPICAEHAALLSGTDMDEWVFEPW